MLSVSLHGNSSNFDFKPELEKINNVVSAIKKFSGLIGIVISMPFIAGYFVLAMKLFRFQIKRYFAKILKDLPSMPERDKILLELKFANGKRIIEGQIASHMSLLKTLAERNYFASELYKSLDEINQIILTNTDKISKIVYPITEDVNSDEFFNSLKQEYGNVDCKEWNDKSFDVYDQKY